MRPKATWVVVGIVAAIAVAAGVDALRGEPEPVAQPTGTTEPPTSSTTAAEPAVPPPDGEPAGVLYYTDGDCRLKAVELPGSRPADAPNWDECRFVLSPDGRRVSGAGSAWDPHSDPLRGRLFQSDATTITISTNGGPEDGFKGNAPAWKPDGTLTYTEGSSIREWPTRRVIISQGDLAEAVRASPEVPDAGHVLPVTVREVAWLDNRHAVVLLEGVIGSDGPQTIMAFFEGRRLTAMSVGAGEALSDLRVSPFGNFVGVRSGDGFLLLNARGDVLPAPGVAGYRAITWSPDEQWAAVAGVKGIMIFRPGESGSPELRLGFDAHDLAWRGTAGPAPLASVDAARNWLTRAGMAGRLFVTRTESGRCVLRALRLPELAWADRPRGVPSPCRFRLDDDDASAVGAVTLALAPVRAESVVPQPGGDETATCQDGGVDVFDGGGAMARYEGACAPAWRPDGTLTFVQDGGLYARERPLLTREKLTRILGQPSALEEVAWLDDERFWAVVRSGPSAIVALLSTEALVFSPSFTTRAIEGLELSATGMVAAQSDQGVVVFDSGGRRAMTFPNGNAVSWAPGELIAAIATPNEVLFVAPVSREVVSLPLPVRDLDWVVP